MRLKSYRKSLVLWGGVSVLVLLGIGAYVWHHQPKPQVRADQPKELVSSVSKASDTMSRLCSPYAHICFAYPANWERATHVSGSADPLYALRPASGIELNNPATGTALSFMKAGVNTETTCNPACVCSLNIKTLNRLDNGLYVLAASIESVEPTAGADIYTPFVGVVSASTLKAAGIATDASEAGKTVAISSFNLGFSVANGGEVELWSHPGIDMGPNTAATWLNSAEAQSMVSALASVTLQT